MPPDSGAKEPTSASHPLPADLRLFAYKLALGEEGDASTKRHLAECPKCQFWMAVLRATDSFLTGEDVAHMNALIRESEDGRKSRAALGAVTGR